LISHVVLFDVDGTLISNVKSMADERDRFLESIYAVVGREPSVVPSSFAGMVDPQICKILLAKAGLNEEKVKLVLPRVLERMREIYREMEKKPVLNEGVEELLRILTASKSHIVGVLTGNLSAVAKQKLRLTGIASYFVEGFYSDDYLDRKPLIEDAVKKCVMNYKLPGRKNVLLIGDTPRDVSAANAAMATSIGIASGVFSMEQLSQANATYVFPDLKPSRELLGSLGLG